jgi:hypothetical protein
VSFAVMLVQLLRPAPLLRPALLLLLLLLC